MLPENIKTRLQEPYMVSDQQLSFYQVNRFIKLKQVLDEETLDYVNGIISKRIERFQQENNTPLSDRDTYGKAFLQVMNLWREDEDIQSFIFSKRIAGIATQLMDTQGVRLYHDQALFKEPGGGITPWHADQFYWPLNSDKTVTAWIPLQAVPLEMGPLEFCAGSHQIQEGRELAISDNSEKIMQERLKVTDFPHVIEPFDAGEISFHSGWVFHRAGANNSNEMRKVMTIIYMDSNMRLKAPENSNQQNDWDTWCPGAIIDEIIETPLNPLLHSID